MLKVSRGLEGAWETQEVYLDSGAQLSGSAVGARFGNKLLIGPVFDPHFLVCTLGDAQML